MSTTRSTISRVQHISKERQLRISPLYELNIQHNLQVSINDLITGVNVKLTYYFSQSHIYEMSPL